MLIINGGLAMLNGLLLASYSVFCSCIMGGTCCNGVCECGDGTCCDDVWHTDEGVCCCLPPPCITLAYSEYGIPGEMGHCGQTLLPGSVQTITVPDGYHYVRITGSVDDELLIDGVVIQPGEFGDPCNGGHVIEPMFFAQEGSFTVACADNHGVNSGYNLAICFYTNNAWYDGMEGYEAFKCWHPAGENPCAGGKQLFAGPYCCGCIEPGTELCCAPGIPTHESVNDECKQRCCWDPSNPTNCTDEFPSVCTGTYGGTSLEGSCSEDGCPGACCTENAEGTEMTCVDVDDANCVSPAIKDMTHPCGYSACHGMCCNYVDDAYTEMFWMSLADCIAAGGEFQGVGTNECASCNGDTGPQSFRCRPPFTDCCCEEKTSTGAGLVFTAPRNKQRYPPLDAGKSKQFTVELRTESDIMIHGELFSAYSQCLTTVVCHDEINVEPVPCGTNFTNLWIKVCWSDSGYTLETLPFPVCQGLTIWLGNCESATEANHCTTRTEYDGNGLTSDVDIVLYGDARITANGTGALVITAPITNQGGCARTLTIDGINEQLNSINGGITEAQGGETMTLIKQGVGLWRLGASSNFEGQLHIKQGTIIAGVGTGPSGSGVFGSGVAQATLPMVGDSSGGATGFAAMLLEDGVVINRSIQVAALGSGGTQVAILGGANTSGTSTFASAQQIRIGRAVTLQAATGGTVIFGSVWQDSTGAGSPAYSYTIGTAGNLGTVELLSVLATSGGSVSINYGTLSVGLDDKIASTTPVFIGTEASSGTLMLGTNDSSLTLTALTFIGGGSFVTNTGTGVLTMTSPATITVQSGTGHEISSNIVLASNLTVHVPLGATLLISGDISGAFTLTRTGCGTLTLIGTNTSTIVNIPC